jgi:putative methyltransferase (TIGR04325 family)
MSIKIFKSIFPPFLINAFIRVKSYIGFYEWKYVAEEWDESYSFQKAWDLNSISELQLEKWKNYTEIVNSTLPLGLNHEAGIPYNNQNIVFHNLLMTFSYVAALASLHKKKISFLDWGGGIGHYGLLMKKMLPDIEVNYFCYDFNAFCVVGNNLWLDNSVFSSNREEMLEVNKYDLVMASSSIWYEPSWKAIFKRLIDASKNYLLITRMLFIEKAQSYVALQRPSSMGYKTEYYFWVINEDEFLSFANESGLVLVRKFIVSDKIYILRAPEQGKFKGFLFRKTANDIVLSN